MNNSAPPDMVGHVGVYEAAIMGLLLLIRLLMRFVRPARRKVIFCPSRPTMPTQRKQNFPDSKVKTSYTTNKVPFIMPNQPKGWSLAKTTKGVLGDVAPTVLKAMGLKQY
jgi:2,3-bisphosphoglycerate-independent phosphoglycerate mutase